MSRKRSQAAGAMGEKEVVPSSALKTLGPDMLRRAQERGPNYRIWAHSYSDSEVQNNFMVQIHALQVAQLEQLRVLVELARRVDENQKKQLEYWEGSIHPPEGGEAPSGRPTLHVPGRDIPIPDADDSEEEGPTN